MSNIKSAFSNKKAFITYLMAGDPSIEKSAEYILAAQEGGADLIEVGIPFSDPIAEGEVIQKAAVRALEAGTTLEDVFAMMETLKRKMKVPVVFMTYLNPVFVYGYERFLTQCNDVGISGLIIPDMPFEEQGELKCVAKKHDVDIITLVAPTSNERVRKITEDADGFIYLVSSMGVTGVRESITTDILGITKEIKKVKDIPVAVGFGISKPEQATDFAKKADGVIVGSAIVKIIAEDSFDTAEKVKNYVAEMKNAIK